MKSLIKPSILAAVLGLPITAMAACPGPTITGNVTGAPVFSHTGGARFMFQFDGDPQLYAIPVWGSVNAAGQIVQGVLDPNGCLPPGHGRTIQASQVNALVTVNKLIQGLNAAFSASMPLLTLSVDVSTDTLTTDDGTGFVVYDHDQPNE